VHITFADDRAGLRAANRTIEAFARSLSQTFEIRFEL
jgi:hypothetical protein